MTSHGQDRVEHKLLPSWLPKYQLGPAERLPQRMPEGVVRVLQASCQGGHILGAGSSPMEGDCPNHYLSRHCYWSPTSKELATGRESNFRDPLPIHPKRGSLQGCEGSQVEQEGACYFQLCLFLQVLSTASYTNVLFQGMIRSFLGTERFRRVRRHQSEMQCGVLELNKSAQGLKFG